MKNHIQFFITSTVLIILTFVPSLAMANIKKIVFHNESLVLNREVLSDVPDELRKCVSPELLKIIYDEKTDLYAETVAMWEKIYPHVANKKNSIKIVVTDEKGMQIENASVQLTQIRELSNSNELEYHGEFIPYKKMLKTGKDGTCFFTGIDVYNLYSLLISSFFENVPSVKPNLRVRVQAKGFNEARHDFLNIDKATISILVNMMSSILKSEKKYIEKGGKITTKFKGTATFPLENFQELVTLKIALKKDDANEESKNKVPKNENLSSKIQMPNGLIKR